MDENLIQRNQNFSTIISWLYNNHCSANQSKKNDSYFNPQCRLMEKNKYR